MNPLAGKQIAFTGRLATMTRLEAQHLVVRLGGVVSGRVSRKTHWLIVGQEGLPLESTGALTRNLRTARWLNRCGTRVTICTEEQWLAEIGCEPAGGVHRLLNAVELTRVLQVSRDRLRAWVRFGLIHPAQTVQGVSYFDFAQVAAAKRLLELTKQGVTTNIIRKSLERLQQWFGSLDRSLLQLSILERNGRLLVRMEEGHLADPQGQMHFEFSEEHPASYQLSSEPRTPEGWFERGCEYEDAAQYSDAAAAYRQALLMGGPSAEICFNLANVLYALGQKPQASERFRQAVEIDPEFLEAWNNLGIVLAEMKQCDDAIWAYRKALELDPHYADVHYNLADCLDRNGCTTDARQHWEAYTRLDPASEWGRYAQGRLAHQSLRATRRKRQRKQRGSV